MAPLTRSGHKYAEASKLEQFSPELTVQVLEFAELHERLNLARCSTMLLKRITKDCPQLWVHIVFIAHVNRHWMQETALTDDMLAALLKRVNARKITKYIDINGCRQVRGSGLAPLRGSRVLERVNLFQAKESVAMDILRSSIRHQLFHVRFLPFITLHPPGFLSQLPNDLSTGRPFGDRDSIEEEEQLVKRNKFLRKLNATKCGQEQSTKCSCCNQFVRDESRQIVPFLTGPPSTRCYQCQGYFCRTGSCPIGLQDCCRCGISSCDTCNLIRRCSECARSSCGREMCFNVSPPCYFCNKQFCYYCQNDGKPLPTCDVCNKTICKQCQQQNGISMEECDDCIKMYYADCARRETCFDCGDSFCTLCSDNNQCFECFGWFCSECKHTCLRCKRGLCEDCDSLDDNPLEQCGQCRSWFCSTCSEMRSCDTCTRLFCPGSDLVSCDSCGKKACKKCGRRASLFSACIACNESFCDTCREVNHGICSVCAEKKPPAKKAKKVTGSSVEEKKPRAASENNFIRSYYLCKREWMS